MRSRKSTVQSCKYYTVQLREKYGHSNITVNRNYYGQRLALKLPAFDLKIYKFFLRVCIYIYIYIYIYIHICIYIYIYQVLYSSIFSDNIQVSPMLNPFKNQCIIVKLLNNHKIMINDLFRHQLFWHEL